mgnify:CR=1 FL=1
MSDPSSSSTSFFLIVLALGGGVYMLIDGLRRRPVVVGTRIRAVAEIISAEEVKGAIQAVVRVTIEIEGRHIGVGSFASARILVLA